VERSSDLLIQGEVVEVEEGSMAVVLEKGDRQQQGSSEDRCNGLSIEPWLFVCQRSHAALASLSQPGRGVRELSSVEPLRFCCPQS